jgi:hypothetical protein
MMSVLAVVFTEMLTTWMGIDQNLGNKKPKNPELFSITGMHFIQEKVAP